MNDTYARKLARHPGLAAAIGTEADCASSMASSAPGGGGGGVMDELLNAPCVFCGYNGAGYWQAKSHLKSCPWHTVGGFDDRRARMPDILKNLHARLAEVERERDALRAALLSCARQAEALKRECGVDPETAQAIRNAQYQNISTTAHIALGTIRGPSAALEGK